YPQTTREYDDFLKAVKEKNVELVKARPGQTVDLGDGAILSVLAPTEPFFDAKDLSAGGNEPNANSIVMRLDYGEFSMLLASDAEEQTERRMFERGANLSAEVLKVAHHGSKYATSADFLKRGRLPWALASTRADNPYALPCPHPPAPPPAPATHLLRPHTTRATTTSPPPPPA